MSTPTTVSTRWQENAVTTDVDGDQMTISVCMSEITSGETFVVSVTGRGKANAGFFTGALRAVAAAIDRKIGQPPAPGVTHEPKLKHH